MAAHDPEQILDITQTSQNVDLRIYTGSKLRRRIQNRAQGVGDECLLYAIIAQAPWASLAPPGRPGKVRWVILGPRCSNPVSEACLAIQQNINPRLSVSVSE